MEFDFILKKIDKSKFNNSINELTTLIMDDPLLCCVKNELTF